MGVVGREGGGVVEGGREKGEKGKFGEGVRQEGHAQWVGGDPFPKLEHLRW